MKVKRTALLIGLLLSGSAVRAAQVSDNFDRTDTVSGTNGPTIGTHWVNSDPSDYWNITGGELLVRTASDQGILYNNTFETVSGDGAGFTIKADVSIPNAGGWGGVVFNYQNPSNFYALRFKAGARNYQLLSCAGGKLEIIREERLTPAFVAGKLYTLTVASDAAYTFKFTLLETGNSKVLNRITTAIDSRQYFIRGHAGLYSGSRGSNPSAVFDHFDLKDSAAPIDQSPEDLTRPTVDSVIVGKVPVQSIWSATPVAFALETVGNRQFVAFYDVARQMVVGQRSLDSTEWTFQKLPTALGWDSHNYVEMTLDDDGYIHVSGNMHVVPLIYFRSEKPYDVTSLKRIKNMTGEKEARCTYPRFLRGAGGELLFTYRDGSSGKGDQIYNIYDHKTQTWTRFLDTPLLDGQGLMNAYFQGPTLGKDGYFHLSWVWRDTFHCETNHDLSYARSKDLIHWETVTGNSITLPIRLDTPGVLVDPVPVEGGMLNGNGRISFDTQGRVMLAYHKFDANGITQLYNARLENGAWNIVQTSDWNYRWFFSGGGAFDRDIKISAIQVKNGELRQGFSHKEEGSKVFVLNEETLRPERTVDPAALPGEITTLRSRYPKMRIKTQAGRSRQPGDVKYMLRWESLPNAKDVSRPKPWPEPSWLEVYTLKNGE